MRWMLSRSIRRKLLATALALATFFLLYEATAMDSRSVRASEADAPMSAVIRTGGARLAFKATAYCKGQTTASGVRVRSGIAAADPERLPPGSVIQVDGLPEPYGGIYTVLDTGPALVHGNILDIYMWSCHDALAFGRRSVAVTVLRLGWSPKNTTPANK